MSRRTLLPPHTTKPEMGEGDDREKGEGRRGGREGGREGGKRARGGDKGEKEESYFDIVKKVTQPHPPT